METSYLSLDHLSYAYHGMHGETCALTDISFSVKKGEFIAIVGPSGCGKSTLGRCIVGLHTPTSGELVFEGGPLSFSGPQGKELRRKIQMIFQDPYSSLNPAYTVGWTLEELLEKTLLAQRSCEEAVNAELAL